MAEKFEDRINILTGFTDIHGSGEDDAISAWLTEGAKQISMILPLDRLEELSKTATVTSDSGFDLDTNQTRGRVVSVTRKDIYGTEQICRKISKIYASRASDPNDLMAASSTDPLYYMDYAKIKILPVPTTSQTAHIMYIHLYDISETSTDIDNFPTEIEHIVVLYAAIKAAESLLQSEGDEELYIPVINSLKEDYAQALQFVGVENMQSPSQLRSPRRQNVGGTNEG